METYLKLQWAGMMFDFLTKSNETHRVSDMFASISNMNERLEILSKQILLSVGTEDAKIEAELYEEMISSEAIRDLTHWKLRPKPVHVFLNQSFRSCAKSLNLTPKIDEKDHGLTLSSNGSISRERFNRDSSEYKDLKLRLKDVLKKYGTTPEKYLSSKGNTQEVNEENEESTT